MPAILGLRSPYDKTTGGLDHLGRIFDKIRRRPAARLPEDMQRSYGRDLIEVAEGRPPAAARS